MIFSNKISSLFLTKSKHSEHYPALDGLRGAAILIVLLGHTSNEHIYIHKMINLERASKIGVYLFFLLSAYLLDRQIIKALIEKKKQYTFLEELFIEKSPPDLSIIYFKLNDFFSFKENKSRRKKLGCH